MTPQSEIFRAPAIFSFTRQGATVRGAPLRYRALEKEMTMPDPGSVLAAAGAVKAAFASVRSVVGLLKDVKDVAGGTEEQKKVIDAALTTASSNTAIAEAEVANALGYGLCMCEFPPTPMLTVGYFSRKVPGHKEGDPVTECPKCGYCNAGPFMFERTKPGAG